MSPIVVGSTIVGVGLTVATLLSQVELWQRKEYRWDRLRSLLFSDESRALITYWHLASMLALDIGWIAFIINRPGLAEVCGVISLACATANTLARLLTRGVYRPKPTVKATLICGVALTSCIGYLFFFFVSTQFIALQWATLLIFIPMIVAGSVGLVALPVSIRKGDIVAQAYKHRRTLPKLTVVGITGSYGKTSTKYFLQQLLAGQPNVIVSQAHRNSALTIAQDMLKQLRPTTRTYVAEMGAYRPGEIREIATLVQPRIGVLTAIGNQHLALFGSPAAIAQTKWELVDALPSGGTAVLNAADATIRAHGQEISQQVIWYSTETTSTLPNIQVQVKSIRVEPLALRLELEISGRSFNVVLPLVSQALLPSAIAAAATAHALRLPLAEIIRSLQQLRPYARTMEPVHTKSGTLIIDDSYSANEVGVVMAIDHLRHFPNTTKIVVLAPLIELGSLAPQVHERIGQALAKSGARVYITGTSYAAALQRGATAVSDTFTITVIDHPKRLIEELAREVIPDSVVLLEGRIPEIVRQAALKL